MTVFSINKQALEQSNLTHASAKQADSAQALFSAALAQHQVRVGPATPATETAFKVKFDRRAAEPRPERAERPAAEPAERAGRRTSERFERPKAAPAERAARQDNDIRPEPQARGSDAPMAGRQDAEKAESQSAAPADTSSEPEAASAPAAEAVAVVVPTQQNAVPAPTVQAAAAAAPASATPAQSTEDGDPDLDPFAWLSKESAPEIEAVEAQLDAGDDLVDLDIDFAEPVPAQTQAASAQRTAPQGQAAIDPAIADDLVTAQANDIARKLAGTGANVKVAVTVDAAPQAVADPAAVKAEADAALDQQIAQAPSPDGAANGRGQNGQAGSQQGGQQNAGLANAAQQVAGNPAIANAQAAAAARPFAAQLAAQVEGASQGGQQAGSAPAAAMGPGAAQGAAKPAAAQAPQAPQQPRHVDPKQVIDQVSVQIAKQAKGGADTIRVQLKPVDLGKIEIRLEVQDGKVTAHVSADSKDTLAILQRDSRGLERALQDAGLKTEASSMNFSLSGDGQQARNDAKPARRSRLAHAAKAVGDAAPQAAAQPMRSGGRPGVDIKV